LVTDYTNAKIQSGIGAGADSDPRFLKTPAAQEWVNKRDAKIFGVTDQALMDKIVADFTLQSTNPDIDVANAGRSGLRQSLIRKGQLSSLF
jgi:hypothetical protein